MTEEELATSEFVAEVVCLLPFSATIYSDNTIENREGSHRWLLELHPSPGLIIGRISVTCLNFSKRFPAHAYRQTRTNAKIFAEWFTSKRSNPWADLFMSQFHEEVKSALQYASQCLASTENRNDFLRLYGEIIIALTRAGLSVSWLDMKSSWLGVLNEPVIVNAGNLGISRAELEETWHRVYRNISAARVIL